MVKMKNKMIKMENIVTDSFSTFDQKMAKIKKKLGLMIGMSDMIFFEFLTDENGVIGKERIMFD